jgi:hypothetical protein
MSIVMESSGEDPEESEEAEHDEDWRELGERLAAKKFFADAEDDSEVSFGIIFKLLTAYHWTISKLAP